MDITPPFIPPRTRAELQSPAPPGHRHEQMKNLVLPLLGAGLTERAVFVQLREMYDQTVTDHEIWNFIRWAVEKNPLPCNYRGKARVCNAPSLQAPPKPERVTADQAIANTEQWLGDFRCNEYDLWDVSPWRPQENWWLDAQMLLAAHYAKDEFINIITDFTIEDKNGEQKANPKGAGQTLLRDEWMCWFRDRGVPQTEAGAWIRPNPVKQRGTGKDGAVTDADVTSHRFCLLESDALPIDRQLSLWARLPLPIGAIIESGGRSVHAWVLLECANAQEYRTKVGHIYSLLAPFGICSSNKNPSRLARMPGAKREVGKHGDGMQRLLYINDQPRETSILTK